MTAPHQHARGAAAAVLRGCLRLGGEESDVSTPSRMTAVKACAGGVSSA
jgi:hypothetical protein